MKRLENIRYNKQMNEKVNFSVKDSIKRSRDIKKASKANSIVLEGYPSKNVQEIEQQVSQVLAEILLENREWIEEQKRKIVVGLSSISEEKVAQSFEVGLMLFFRQQYRLFTKDQPMRKRKIPEILQNGKYIRQQITAYAFDFIQLLKALIKYGITSSEALEIAEASYRHNPDVLKNLNLKYPGISKTVINRTLIGYSSNPEKFIDSYFARVEELKLKYPGVDPYIIKEAALKRPNNAEDFIKKYIANGENSIH